MLDPDALLHDLTDAQREAVSNIDGAMLVLAGPGSGKTRVITRRVAYLIANGIPAWQILAVTFTNKAAAEMRERIDGLVPETVPGRKGLTVSTFHALCTRLLRKYAEQAGLKPSFVIYDAQDQRTLIGRAVEESELQKSNWPAASVGSAISAAKNELLDVDAFAQRATDFRGRQLARIYRAYQRLLAAANAVDFDDLLLRTASLLEHHPDVAQEVGARFRHLLVDEYQDTNRAQFVIARAIAADSGNLCVVGDPDQSIYGWRGADVRNILDFEAHFPKARVVALGENFRSTTTIVDASAALIGHNRQRRDKRLFSVGDTGAPVALVAAATETHEADVVLDAIQRWRDEGIPYGEMAVLYRMNALSRVIEDALRDASIPYQIVRGTAFYDRREVRDAIAFLRVVLNPDDIVSLDRIVNVPPRGLGATSLARISAWGTSRGLGLFAALEQADGIEGVSARAAAAAHAFTSMITRWRDGAERTPASESTLPRLVDRVLQESGLVRHFARPDEQESEDEDRAANVLELVNAAAKHEAGADTVRPIETALDQLAAWLEAVSLVADSDANDTGSGAVTLMTLHAAKGLEYDAVAMVGLEQGLLPHARSATSDAGLEEERRLCYVGMTRARRHLMLSFAASRSVRGWTDRTLPSQFLDELPEEAITRRDLSRGGDGDESMHRGGHRAGQGIRSSGGTALRIGGLVRHDRWGVGRVEGLNSRGPTSSIQVRFADVGVKTLVLSMAPIVVLDEGDVVGDPGD